MKSKSKKPRHKKTNSQKHNKPKGKLLEQVVAALYETPGAKIQTNVDYPTKDGKSTREIDILWTTNIAGLSVEYAFQCKNEAKPIGVGKLSQFFGDLDDIGVPAKYGIFVSVNGFTEDAQRYAISKGIKILVHKGLSADRLKSEISAAIQHNIYLIPRINELSVINAASSPEHEYQFFIFTDENQRPVGTIHDLLFNKWWNGEIPQKLGDYTVTMSTPKNWFQFYKEKPLPPMKVSAKVSVLAAVISIDGIAENHILLDAETNKIERAKTQVTFQGFKEGDEVPLAVFSSEKELNDFVEKSKVVSLAIKTTLPRIISNKSYYPISEAVVEKILEYQQKEDLNLNELSEEKFDEILDEILSDIEKNDLFREGIYNFWGKPVSVIVTDNDGDLIDLNLLAEKGDFEKIISFNDKYRESPSNSFRLLLAWANEQKAAQLFNKTKETNVNHTNILKQSLKHIQIAHKFNPESISVLDLRAELLYSLEDYKEALNTINLILTKKSKDIEMRLNRINTLIKLKEWDLALAEIKNTEKFLKSPKNGVDVENAKNNIKLYLAEILHGKGDYKQSWAIILEVWNTYPEETIRYLSGRKFVNDVVSEAPTIEIRWFQIELSYFRATQFLKIHEYERVSELADYAVILLNNFKLKDQMEEEPIAFGEVSGSFVQNILERIAKLLRNTGNETFAEEQINKISNWFERIYKEEPTFLKN